MHENPNTQPADDLSDRGAEAARALNTHLRKIIELEPYDEDFSFNFFCECGCYEPAPLPIAKYDALEGKTLYAAGHAPIEKRYGVTIRPGE